MPDQRETLVRRMVEEGTSDDDIRATLKAFDVSPLRKPVSAEDFMRPEDIANRDNGTPLALDVLKGFGKRAIGSLVGMGEMASTGIAESAARTAAQAAASVAGRPSPFNPVIRDPALLRIDEAVAPTNKAQELGGRMELAAELAPGAIGLAKAVPSLARGAVSLAKGGAEALARGAVSDTPVLTQVRQAVSRKLLGRLLDGGKAVDDIPQMLDELQPPASFTGTAATPPQTIAAPGGFSMPPSVPAKPVPPPPGRVVPAAPRVPVEDQLATALAEVRQPAPVTVTTPPPAELPPGYTPRTTVPKPAAPPKARQAKATLAESPAEATEAPANAKPYAKGVTHITTPEGAEGIRAKGFDVNRRGGGIGGDDYGPGIYASDTSRDLGSFWRSQLETKNEVGTVAAEALKGKANLQRALVIDDMKPLGGGRYGPRTPEEIVSKYMPSKMADFQEAVKSGASKNAALGDLARKSGYDGMVFERSAGDEVIAFKPQGVAWEGTTAAPTPKPRAPRAEPPTTQPARRAYFLRSPEEMAAMRAPVEPVEASGSITIDDLPEAWKSRTGQDLFPTTGAEAKELTAAMRDEIKARGLTIGQAIAEVSRNKSIPTSLRHQITRALSGGK